MLILATYSLIKYHIKVMWGYGLDWAGSGKRKLAGTCECGNETSVSINCGEFLDWLQIG
jgi:hypothetical protein